MHNKAPGNVDIYLEIEVSSMFFYHSHQTLFKNKKAETGKYLCQIKDCQSGSFFPYNTTLMKHLFRVHHLKPKLAYKISKIIDCQGIIIAPKLSKISFVYNFTKKIEKLSDKFGRLNFAS